MLSFHEPHSLMAEAALAAVALLVVLYRVCGGSNEWLRTHGLILVTYYSFGGLAYDELEGWALLDTTYFLTVTVTTVGYGDMCPETVEGQLFTVIYALLGLVFVFAALSPLLDALVWFKDLLLGPCTPPDPMETDDDGVLDLDDLRSRGNWGFKYVSALMGPIIVFVLGLIIGYFVLNLDTVDGVYWSMITMTTIGYGDISGSSPIEKAILCLYLPTAVAALADALTAVQTIGTAKDLVYSNFALSADKLLLGEAGGQHPNPDETLTEAEFLISVLKEKGIVDDMTVQAIRLQFAHITRHDTSTNSNKVLDDKIVFLELCSQGRILSPKQGGATKVIIEGEALEVDFVDTSAVDGGFQEWRERYWWPRVFDGKQHGQAGYARLHTEAHGALSEAAAAKGYGSKRGGGAPPARKAASPQEYGFPFYELLEDGTAGPGPAGNGGNHGNPSTPPKFPSNPRAAPGGTPGSSTRQGTGSQKKPSPGTPGSASKGPKKGQAAEGPF